MKTPALRRLLSLVCLGLLGAVPCLADEPIPLEHVRPGMKGVGRTVFAGSRIEEFSVEIIGVMENALAPKQSIVMARLSGGPLAETGVIAGMSGSPVYIDGKLLGAVSFGFPFSKETIAGITPLKDMIAATATTGPRAASVRAPGPTEWPTRSGLFNPAVFAAAMRSRAAMVDAGTPQSSAPSLSRLLLPLSFGGFDRGAFESVRGLFADFGFTPVFGGAAGRSEGALPALEPGSPIGVSLVEGDVDLSATGTVTHIEGDRVYAFGHPFYNLGPTRFPMKKAFVHGVFPSVYQSWKIASAREAIGTLEQDRIAGIAGRLGPPPRMIPVSVRLQTSRGDLRSFSFRIVDDELLSPLLAYASMFSLLQANERALGTSTMHVTANLTFSGGRVVRVEDLYTQLQPALQSATLVAAPITYVLSNHFEPVALEKVDVEVSSLETIQSAAIERAWVDTEKPARPGESVPLRLVLRTYRGDAVEKTVAVAVPANAREGTYSLLVADAATLDGLDQHGAKQSFAPRTLDQLFRAINAFRPSSRVYVRLSQSDDGAFVSGESLPSLPPSALAVLRGRESGAEDSDLRSTTLFENNIDAGLVVSGSRLLPLTIKR